MANQVDYLQQLVNIIQNQGSRVNANTQTVLNSAQIKLNNTKIGQAQTALPAQKK